MALFKCKMCGGTIEVGDESVVTCDYCGTRQTLPKLSDERHANLHDRASHFRRSNEFDKAMGIYEQILTEDNTDAEAYWSLVLCRYGIEYVEDPSTRKRVPTVNRAQFTSIFDDVNYKSALEHADMYQRILYEAEAKAINEIQKGILAISQKEDPFDVFICYKETDNNGRRTLDSVLANELYHQLIQEGFKVFFSRITLEDKLGVAYEPYIFAALNSAKVMVVLGTKKEYFNAVWVKNEWSRYLTMIRGGAKKVLIPAYRDIDPYDLPDEFSHLQAQDMSKLGFMQDLIRGIKKLTQPEEIKQPVVRETVVNSANTNLAPLLKRAFLFLEDKDWKSADEYCERVLDNDPECAEAYLGKLMAELQVCKQDDLKDCKKPFDNRNNYQKTFRFADSQLREFMVGCIIHINERNETVRLEGIYVRAKALMELATQESAFKEAAQLFETISHYKDAAAQAQECYMQGETARKEAIYTAASNLMASNQIQNYQEAIKRFQKIKDYKDSTALIQECRQRAEAAKKDAVYNGAKKLMTGKQIANYQEAIKRFSTISGWKDVDEQIERCHDKINEIEAEKERKREQTEVRVKKVKKLTKTVTSYVCIILVVALMLKYCEPISLEVPKSEVPKSEVTDLDLSDRITTRTVSACGGRFAAVREDGTVFAEGYDVSQWTDVIAVDMGPYYIVGLKADGTVVTTDFLQGEIAEWTDIVAIGMGGNYIVGLKADGKVVASAYTPNLAVIKTWKNIIAISAGDSHTVGLKMDGTVVATGNNQYGQCDVSEWTDIVAISAGLNHTVGLKADGTVVAIGENEDGQCDVSSWTDIVAISAGDTMTLGLKSDGTMVMVGMDADQFDFSGWTDIVAVEAGYWPIALRSDGTLIQFWRHEDSASGNSFSMWRGVKLPASIAEQNSSQSDLGDKVAPVSISAAAHVVALKEDGTVAAVGLNEDGQCEVSEWEDIVSISAKDYHTVGLKSDGTVVAVGAEHAWQGVSDWHDILSISAGCHHTVGLTVNGTVVAAGTNSKGQCDVLDWMDIVEIGTGTEHTVGLKSDGTVVAAGRNDYGQCDISEWTDIVAISAGYDHTVGLKADGTVVAVGRNDYGQCDITEWTDIVAISAGHDHTVGLKADGTVVAVGFAGRGACDVNQWSDIVSIAAGYHTIALKSDGTLLYAGDNYCGDQGANGWTDIKLPGKLPSGMAVPGSSADGDSPEEISLEVFTDGDITAHGATMSYLDNGYVRFVIDVTAKKDCFASFYGHSDVYEFASVDYSCTTGERQTMIFLVPMELMESVTYVGMVFWHKDTVNSSENEDRAFLHFYIPS